MEGPRTVAAVKVGLNKEAIERVCKAVAYVVVRRCQRPEPSLIEARVSLCIVCARHCASTKRPLTSPWADHHIVRNGVGHLVAIFDIYACAPDVSDHIGADDGIVGAMYDDPPLMTVLDGIMAKSATGGK